MLQLEFSAGFLGSPYRGRRIGRWERVLSVRCYSTSTASTNGGKSERRCCAWWKCTTHGRRGGRQRQRNGRGKPRKGKRGRRRRKGIVGKGLGGRYGEIGTSLARQLGDILVTSVYHHVHGRERLQEAGSITRIYGLKIRHRILRGGKSPCVRSVVPLFPNPFPRAK